MAVTRDRNFEELIDTTFDANVLNGVTASLKISTQRHLLIDVAAVSGANTTHVITLQFSVDDSTWQDTSHTVAQITFVDDITINARYVRAKVTTAEGGASIVSVRIQAKP